MTRQPTTSRGADHHAPGQSFAGEQRLDDSVNGDERESLLPSFNNNNNDGRSSSRRKRRNSNGHHDNNGDGGNPLKAVVQEARDKVSTLCFVATVGVVAITLLLLIYVQAIPSPFSRGNGRSGGGGGGRWGSTNPNDGKGPTVVVPDEPFKLPPPTGLPRNDAYLVQAENGAVAAEDITCSRMGVDILKRGGNAVDAAITTCLCIGVLNSFSSGIGGGGFMLVRVPEPSSMQLQQGENAGLVWSDKVVASSKNNTSSSSVVAIDFRETSPSASHRDLYIPIPGSSQVGGLAVGVPGEIRGLQTAFEMYGSGRLTWEQLFEPNVQLARGGWRVSRELARRFRIFGSFMVDKPQWNATFRPRGSMLVEGDWMDRRNYSRSLEAIGKNGGDYFYKDSWIADEIVESIKREGGIMTKQDLAEYKVRVYDAIKGTYHGRKVYTTDAPTCGPMLLMMLNALEPYDLSRQGHKLSNTTRNGLNIHRMVESLKFAFARRTEISDPASPFTDKARFKRIQSFSLKEFGREVHANITDDRTHSASYYNPVFDVPNDSGTTHLSVVDKWGGAVSLTSTVNLIFGSRVMTPHGGIILNDEQDDFSTPGKINAFGLAPSPYNYPEAGKRPLSSTSPMIAEYEDGSFYTAMGGSGGSRIYGAVAQTFFNMEWGMDISEAVESPRFHDQLFPPTVTLESDFDKELIDGLKSRGHNVTMFDINLGVAEVQAVMQMRNGSFFAASDSRKNGRAWGY